MTTSVLTLLTDFGLQDSYVGVMKGVILQVNPQLTVIDLTHQIPAQDVASARFALTTAVPYFPKGAVHLVVVDPGVGTQRRAIALALGDDLANPTAFMVGPDNGCFSGVVAQYPLLAAVELTHPRYWRTPNPSPTFHGRDIFAPVAAHLASGVPLADVGALVAPDTLVTLPLPGCTVLPDTGKGVGLRGGVQAVDYFGNVITTISGQQVTGKQWQCYVGDRKISGCITYGDAPVGEALALVGSHGWVEIAVNQGNAYQQIGIDWKQPIEVWITG